jgi:hypothetical protein
MAGDPSRAKTHAYAFHSPADRRRCGPTPRPPGTGTFLRPWASLPPPVVVEVRRPAAAGRLGRLPSLLLPLPSPPARVRLRLRRRGGGAKPPRLRSQGAGRGVPCSPMMLAGWEGRTNERTSRRGPGVGVALRGVVTRDAPNRRKRRAWCRGYLSRICTKHVLETGERASTVYRSQRNSLFAREYP